MLSPFIKKVISRYDEEQYYIASSDWSEILNANAQFEESERMDLRALEVFQRRISLALSAVDISVPKDGVVIDLCCGTGVVARALICTKKACRVIGMDLSRAQLNLLRWGTRNAPEFRERLSVLQANALHLPVATDSVDMVIGNSFLHHLPDVGAGLVEIRRVLRPGGQFVALHEPSLTSTFFESFPLSLLKNVVVENYTDLWQFAPADLTRLLKDAGFSKIKILKTGILSNVLLGAFSIIVNKYFLHWKSAQELLQYLRGYLNALEYKFSWSKAPSLLITASK